MTVVLFMWSNPASEAGPARYNHSNPWSPATQQIGPTSHICWNWYGSR